MYDRVTACPILNDALETGELDYINGGTSTVFDLMLPQNEPQKSYILVYTCNIYK